MATAAPREDPPSVVEPAEPAGISIDLGEQARVHVAARVVTNPPAVEPDRLLAGVAPHRTQQGRAAQPPSQPLRDGQGMDGEPDTADHLAVLAVTGDRGGAADRRSPRRVTEALAPPNQRAAVAVDREARTEARGQVWQRPVAVPGGEQQPQRVETASGQDEPRCLLGTALPGAVVGVPHAAATVPGTDRGDLA
jgi:hypothetical protein